MSKQAEISKWIITQISQLLMVSEDELSTSERLYELGVDSQDTMALVAKIGAEYDLTIKQSVVEEHDSIEKLSAYVANALSQEA